MTSIRRAPTVAPMDAQDLDWLLDQWLDSYGDSQTARGYAFKVAHFRRWWAEVGPAQGWRLAPTDLQTFERHLRRHSRGQQTGFALAYHTRNDVLRRLRQALLWAWRQGYTDRNYAQWVPAATGGPRTRTAAPLHILARLMAAAAQQANPLRDQAILAVLIGMGLRRGECARLDVPDVVVEADGSGYARVQGKRTKANATGVRLAAMDAPTGRYMRRYLDVVQWQNGPLWRNPDGHRLSTQGVYRVVKRCARDAHVTFAIDGCHDLRRAFATHYARNRRDETSADLLRRQLGHAKYEMTAHYALMDVEDIRADLISPFALLEAGRT